MGRTLFIDIKDGEFSTYLFEIKGDKYELKENKKYPLSGKYDFSVYSGPENVGNTCLSLPIGALNFRAIDLPFSDKERVREVLPFELDGMILGGSENVVFDNINIGTADNKYQFLAVYLEKKEMRKILEKLKSCEIEPVLVTSLELRPIVKDFNFTKLLSPATLAEEDRIDLAFEEIKSPVINLRRGEFSYAGDIEKTRKSLRITTILLALIGLIFAGDGVFKIVSTRAEIMSIKNEIRKEYQEIFPGEKNIMNELYQLKSHLKELKGKEDILIGVSPLALLNKLSQIDRRGAVVNEFSVDKANITIRGEAQSLSEIQQLQSRLKTVFDEVNISDSKDSAQGRMLFTITAKEKRI